MKLSKSTIAATFAALLIDFFFGHQPGIGQGPPKPLQRNRPRPYRRARF